MKHNEHGPRDPALLFGLQRTPRTVRDTDALVALNFRVPFAFRQRIKLAATTRGMTMTELVAAALDLYLGDQEAQRR